MLIVLVVLLSGMSVYADIPGNLTEDDLVAQWEFDETSGSTVYDSLGNYNGTAKGTTIISGIKGKARRFNGTSDTITFTKSIIPVGNKSIKFSIRRSNIPQSFEWVFATGVSQAAGETNCTAYIRPSSDSRPGALFIYICDKSGGVGASVASVETLNICDNKWHDVMVVFDNDLKKATLYIDDFNTPVASKNYIIGKSDNTDYSRNLKMGANYTSSGANSSYFAGDLDEFEIYNKCYIPAPQNLTATPGDSQVTLAWDAVDGATGYNVKRATASGGPYETVTGAVYQDNTYIDTGLNNNTTYYYVVTAFNSSGESLDSSVVSVTPFAPIVAPDAPANLTAVSGNSKVDLTWSAAEGAVTYTLKRGTADGGPYTVIAEGITATAYTDMSVTNGTKYYYVVSAVNTAGESGNSNQVSATPTAGQIGSDKIMIKTDDGLIYSGDLVEQTGEIFKLKNVYLYNGIPSFSVNIQPTYNWEISFFKNKVIWFYFED